VSNAHSVGEDRTIFERKVIAVDTGRVSGVEEEILGPTSVGEGIFLRDGRGGNARDDTGIYIEHQFEHGDKSHFKIEEEGTKDEFQS
jgi:hypothetical protein